MRFGINLCFSISYFGNTEYFDVKVKSRSFATCNFFARVFTIGSPMIAELISHPILVITSLAGCATIASQFLEKKPLTIPEKSELKTM